MFCKDIKNLPEVLSFIGKQAREIMLLSNIGVDIDVKKHLQKRSNEQNAYYHLICGEVAKFLDVAGLSYGEYKIPYTGELLHELNKKLFGIKTTTKLSKEEFCEYMTKVIQFWQERTNFEWAPSELPDSYLAKKGYTDNYTRGVINDT